MHNKVVLKHFGMGYVKTSGSMVTPYKILKNGGRPTKSIVSMGLLILEH